MKVWWSKGLQLLKAVHESDSGGILGHITECNDDTITVQWDSESSEVINLSNLESYCTIVRDLSGQLVGFEKQRISLLD